MNAEIEQRLRLCPQLPTLSGVAVRLVTAARNPDVDLGQITELISHDPALAARILRIANSSLYPQFRQVHNLAQAVQVLGLNTTVTLSLGFSLAAELRKYQTDGIDLEVLWRRALIAALAARILGQRCQIEVFEELFLAALLQDIGRLALDAALPNGRYVATQYEAADHDALVTRERQQLGTDHLEAGAWLLGQWRLPEFFKLAIWSSHDRGRRPGLGELAPFAGCVAVSGLVADIYLAEDTASATLAAHHVATACLNMTAEDLNAVLDQIASALPEIQELFDTPMLSTMQAKGLTAEAKELIICQNLKTLDAVASAQSREKDLKHVADELYEVAHRDALTNVYNRRHFDEALIKAFAEAGGQRQPLSLAYFDLDNFKLVNDQHGHQHGDTVLCEVATMIQAHLRPSDQLARYGGEEFVVLLPGLDRSAARAVIERIRVGIEGLAITLAGGQRVAVTLSVGVATYDDGVHGPGEPADLIKAADQALYQAKRQGRNRLVQAP